MRPPDRKWLPQQIADQPRAADPRFYAPMSSMDNGVAADGLPAALARDAVAFGFWMCCHLPGKRWCEITWLQGQFGFKVNFLD